MVAILAAAGVDTHCATDETASTGVVHTHPAHTDVTHTEASHTHAAHTDAARTAVTHTGAAHTDVTHTGAAHGGGEEPHDRTSPVCAGAGEPDDSAVASRHDRHPAPPDLLPATVGAGPPVVTPGVRSPEARLPAPVPVAGRRHLLLAQISRT